MQRSSNKIGTLAAALAKAQAEIINPEKSLTARKCESAEELGKRLKRRYDRQKQRQGVGPSRDRAAEAELDRLLAQD